MRPAVFVDSVCPKPYSPDSLTTSGLGGTESTVVRVAEALSKRMPVQVLQHVRDTRVEFGAEYAPLPRKLPKSKAIIVLRNPQLAIDTKKEHQDTPVFLWLHDLVQVWMRNYTRQLADLGVHVIVVSDFHRLNYTEVIRQDLSLTRWPKIHILNCPIDDTLAPSGEAYDPNKLVFFSSPHKGLKETLRLFEMARRQNPNFTLYVSNPGYYEMGFAGDGVVKLGSLSHREALTHVSQALCVFYPNYVFPETFGLVFAEANAVGTPVLTHPHGSAPDVLAERSQLVDCRDHVRVIDRLMQWHRGDRPAVTGQEKFRLSRVISNWCKLLEGK